jgi:hypothetical protein
VQGGGESWGLTIARRLGPGPGPGPGSGYGDGDFRSPNGMGLNKPYGLLGCPARQPMAECFPFVPLRLTSV